MSSSVLLDRFKSLNGVQVLGLIVLSAFALSESIVAPMGWLLTGQIRHDFLLTGLVTSVVVAMILGTIVIVVVARVVGLAAAEELSVKEHTLRAEKASRISEERCYLALEGAGDGVWDWRVGSDEMFISSRAKKMGGYADDEIGNRFAEWTARIHPEDRARVMANLQAYIAGEVGEYLIEHRLRARNGDYRWIRVKGMVVERDGDGRPTRLVGTASDITESVRTAAELENYRHHLQDMVAERTVALSTAKETAEAACRAKTTFLANMSHEIRTPMNAVMGLTHILQRNDPTPEQRDRLDKIADAASHLLGILNDVLDFSKIEAGHMVLEQAEFDPGALATKVRSLMTEKFRAKGLELRVELDGLPRLVGDITRLTQALLNYVGNAAKFTERGGVTVRARILDESAKDVLVRFEVQDTGIGIPADKLERIFAAFEQADSSTTRKYGGTGLGLAINKRLASLMGGETGVESQPGKGSTFWLTARLGKAPARAAGAPTAAGRVGAAELLRQHRCRVLLAEDDPVNQEVALDLLRHGAGLEADLAENGHEAVEMARNGRYDLILMDMQMAGMDGLAATREIRALGGYEATPILAMTANAFSEDRKRCLAAGMNDHIAKPVDPEILFHTMARWLPK